MTAVSRAPHPGILQALCPNSIRCNDLSTCSCLSSLSSNLNCRWVLANPILKSGNGRTTHGKNSMAWTSTWNLPASLSSPAVGSSLCAAYPVSFSRRSILSTAWKSVGGTDSSVYRVAPVHHGPQDPGFSTDKTKAYERPVVVQKLRMCADVARELCSQGSVPEDQEMTGSSREKDEGEGRHAEGQEGQQGHGLTGNASFFVDVSQNAGEGRHAEGQEGQQGHGLTGNASFFVDVSQNASSKASTGGIRSQRPVPVDHGRTGSSPGSDQGEGGHAGGKQDEQGPGLTVNGGFVVDVSKNATTTSSNNNSNSNSSSNSNSNSNRNSPPESTEIAGIIIVDHGSRRRESNEMLDAFVKIFKAHTGRGIVEGAHMELAEPSIAVAFDRCVQRGANLVVVSPYFLSPGRHWFKDIPSLVAAAAAKHPHVRYLIAAPIGLHNLVAEVVDSRIDYCLRHVAGEVPACEMCAGTGFCKMRSDGSSMVQPLNTQFS